MAFTFVQVSKNTYPYRTLHVDSCSVLKRVKYQHALTLDEVRRLDSVRIDYCSRCMGRQNDAPGEAQRSFWGIQNAFKAQEADAWRMVHAARKVVALKLALEEAEKDLDRTDPLQVEMLDTVEREARAGEYSPLEVTVQRR